MKKLIFWIRSKFGKKVKHIDMPRIQILSTGTTVVTEESRDKYLTELKECIDNRVALYPSWEDVIDAMIEERSGNVGPIQSIVRKRKLIKEKYPKPIIGE
jgi:hypothetical protein